MPPSAVLRFRNRGTGIFPAEAIAVPRTLLTLNFEELVPKLVAEFWPAVRDDIEGAAETPVGTFSLPGPSRTGSAIRRVASWLDAGASAFVKDSGFGGRSRSDIFYPFRQLCGFHAAK